MSNDTIEYPHSNLRNKDGEWYKQCAECHEYKPLTNYNTLQSEICNECKKAKIKEHFDLS
jgi:hypothetical protein